MGNPLLLSLLQMPQTHTASQLALTLGMHMTQFKFKVDTRISIGDLTFY